MLADASRRRRLDRIILAHSLEAGCVDTCSCLMTLLSLALAPLVVRLARGRCRFEGGLFLYICVYSFYSFFQDLVLYMKLA